MINDIVCYAHLRWNFVFQRPQHLLTRFAKKHRVIFFEEPVYGEYDDHYSLMRDEKHHVLVVTPHLCHQHLTVPHEYRLRTLLAKVFADLHVGQHIAWYYTPIALEFTTETTPVLMVYDCMDELSAFRNAPEKLVELEKQMFRKADVVFTGGHSLYQHKRSHHHNIYPFPSSIDQDHFYMSRVIMDEPEDQAGIPHPRFGFYGVIDERLDLELVRAVAEQRPNWQIVLIGPFAKIDPEQVPRLDNIHYLGQKHYHELPFYLSGWDVAIMPFALNDATRFISPTKTPEFLAGGKQVISTSIRDVVEPYGRLGLVHIADTAEAFVKAGEEVLSVKDRKRWTADVDSFLAGNSWDRTWNEMQQVIDAAMKGKTFTTSEKIKAYV